MSVCIMVDSACDMLPDEAAKLNVDLLALTVRFGDEEFEDGVTISRDEFYNRLIESDTLPKTSQISPYRYAEHFRKAVDAGDEVVCLTISSKMSGCYQSAMIAASEFEGKVHVVDTLQFCGPEYLLTLRAVEMRNQGMSAADIADAITAERLHAKVIAVFNTLAYLKLGGRISSASAFAGGLLSIKPVITIANGECAIVGKARGSRNGNNLLRQYVEQHGGIDWTKPIILSWSGTSDELLRKYIEDSAVLYKGRRPEDLPRARVGATIGTYAGPGAIAFSFYPKNLRV